MSTIPTVLFVCVHNAGRSQMAAGYLRHLAGDRVEVLSAGSAPGESVNPVAVAAMAEEGIDIADRQPRKLTDDAVRESDVVITMGCGDACPYFPGKRYEDWVLDDPAGQPLEAVRPVRDEIRRRVEDLLVSLGVPVTRELTRPDGMTIAFHEWNGHVETPPVVLQHGYVASTETNWVGPGVVDALVAAGRRVIGVDARGHGKSGTSADRALFGEPTMARDLSAVMDELDVREYQLVGYSMGAVISVLVAAADPRVTRLVVGGVGSAVVELGGVDTRLVDGELLVGALLAEGDLSAYPAGARTFRQLADLMGSHRPSLAAQAQALHAGPTDLARVTVPTLVLAGRDDVLASNPQVLADALPDARLHVVDGDHLGAVSDPGFLAALTTFLEG